MRNYLKWSAYLSILAWLYARGGFAAIAMGIMLPLPIHCYWILRHPTAAGELI